jgi:hypothetical protein
MARPHGALQAALQRTLKSPAAAGALCGVFKAKFLIRRDITMYIPRSIFKARR